VTDHVGRFLARQVNDVTVNCGGDYFILARRRQKLTVTRSPAGPVAVVVPPSKQGVGVSMTIGRGRQAPDGLAVIAESCMLADAAAAGVQAILPKENGFRGALAYLRQVQGVHGGLVLVGERIGVVGSVEIAA
jgi:ApbE superfamily uncharacterized protein (UPF0280 family)